jgi:NAD(P)-dependent dehydrogenase (short-subunit alcohol dehydrogenase family)
MDLHGKVAIVTGGGVRIGRAIAIALANRGVAICLHYGHSDKEAQDTARTIRASGGTVALIQADFQQPEIAAESVLANATGEFEHVDILINNAAIFELGDLQSTSSDNWDRHLDINLKAPFFLCQQFVRQLRPDQRAHIINIADWRAMIPSFNYLAYSVSKSGLVSLTKCLARELSPRIQVNAIAPGAILPPPNQDAAFLEELAKSIPVQRTGNVDDICNALLFLLKSEQVTGEILQVSGGQELGFSNSVDEE